MGNTEKPVDAKVIKTVELTIAQRVEKKITDLKTPLSKFYKNINIEIDAIAEKDLSPELKKEASAKRTELRTKRLACTKFVKGEIDIFKGYVEDWKGVDAYAKLESKNGEDRLLQIEEDCKALAEELINKVSNERFEELKALGETIMPEGLGKMPKLEFKLLLKTTERKVKKRKEAEEKAEEERKEAIKIKAEAEKLKAENEKLAAEKKALEDQNAADLEELKQLRAEKLEREKPAPVEKPKPKKKATNNVLTINEWVDSFELPNLDVEGFTDHDTVKVEFIKNCFDKFKKDSICK